jgi:hypothetical protein
METRQSSSIRIGLVKSQAGQIVVEYVLLLTIAVSIAIIVVTSLVKRDEDPENSGSLIRKWQEIQQGVAKDIQN